MMHLIDSHCHLDFKQYDLNRDQIIHQCHVLGVKQLIIPGVEARDWQSLIQLCQQSKSLFPALGLHPLFIEHHSPDDLILLKELVSQYPIIAIGEIGLDFYHKEHDKPRQIDLFSQQLMIAQQSKLAVLLHVRKAHDQTLLLLRKYPVTGGIVHAFNGSLQQAQQYQDLGFVFGIGGAITNPNATRLRSLVSSLPLSSLVLETDSPDMPLWNMQTRINSPENIPLILTALAEIRTESIEEIAAATTNNCLQIMPLMK